MNLTMVENGLEHGLINTVGNSVPDDGFKRFSEKDRPTMERLKKHECEKIKARYLHRKGVGERLERPYARWSGEPITMWRFLHDHVYMVPRGLVEEVNGSPGLAQRSEVLDANGRPTAKDGAPIKDHQFVPAEF